MHSDNFNFHTNVYQHGQMVEEITTTAGARITLSQSLVVPISSSATHGGPEIKPPTVGKIWTSRSLNRHKEYCLRTLRPLAFSQSDSRDIDFIEKWYEHFQRTVQEFGVVWQDI
jgi:hypothetical protein